MQGGETITVDGSRVKAIREDVAEARQASFSKLSGITLPTLQRIEPSVKYVLRVATLEKMAANFELSVGRLADLLNPEKSFKLEVVLHEGWAKKLKAKAKQMQQRTFQVVRTRQLPFFDVSIPAGRWIDSGSPLSPDNADGWETVPADLSHDAFALRIMGDCMEPRFPTGSVVIFVPVRPGPDGEQFENGGSYYFEHSDSKATFKRVYYEPQRERFRLECYNESYKPLYVPEQQMARMSRAVRMIWNMR